MNDIFSSKGWKNRRKLAEVNSWGNADEERLAIRAERARIYAEAAEADARAAEAHAAAIAAARCSCPACGGTGTVEVPKAASMIEAWHNYNFHAYKPTSGMIAAVGAIARGEPTPPGAPNVVATYGFVLPFSSEAPVSIAVETVEPPKPAKPAKGSKPVADDAAFTHDGALIEF